MDCPPARHARPRPLPGGAAPAPDKASVYAKSILDLVVADTQRLQKNLGKSDRDKLSDYLDSVNELERRVQAALPGTRDDGLACSRGRCRRRRMHGDPGACRRHVPGQRP